MKGILLAYNKILYKPKPIDIKLIQKIIPPLKYLIYQKINKFQAKKLYLKLLISKTPVLLTTANKISI